MKTPTFMMPFEPNKAGRKPILIRKNPITIAIIIPIDIVKTSFQIIIFIFFTYLTQTVRSGTLVNKKSPEMGLFILFF